MHHWVQAVFAEVELQESSVGAVLTVRDDGAGRDMEAGRASRPQRPRAKATSSLPGAWRRGAWWAPRDLPGRGLRPLRARGRALQGDPEGFEHSFRWVFSADLAELAGPGTGDHVQDLRAGEGDLSWPLRYAAWRRALGVVPSSSRPFLVLAGPGTIRVEGLGRLIREVEAGVASAAWAA